MPPCALGPVSSPSVLSLSLHRWDLRQPKAVSKALWSAASLDTLPGITGGRWRRRELRDRSSRSEQGRQGAEERPAIDERSIEVDVCARPLRQLALAGAGLRPFR